MNYVHDELGGIRKEVVVSNFKYYPNIYLKMNRKTTKSLNQNSQHLDRQSNPVLLNMIKDY